MFATVRDTFSGPRQLGQGRAELEEFAALRARQPGFVGSLAVAVAAGAGRVLTSALWESEERTSATQPRPRFIPGSNSAGFQVFCGDGPVTYGVTVHVNGVIVFHLMVSSE